MCEFSRRLGRFKARLQGAQYISGEHAFCARVVKYLRFVNVRFFKVDNPISDLETPFEAAILFYTYLRLFGN